MDHLQWAELTGAPAQGPPTPADLAATPAVDHRHPAVTAWAQKTTAGAANDPDRARLLFAAVRDGVRYDPWNFDPHSAEGLRASTVLTTPATWCVPKAVLLAAGARALGIPARLGFADVRNHLSSPKLRAAMGTDVFAWHGYAVLHLGGAWRKASPAFNSELCARFGVAALDFDGSGDALLHAFDGEGRRHMEYVRDHGTFDDVPGARMLAGLAETYGHTDPLSRRARDGGDAFAAQATS